MKALLAVSASAVLLIGCGGSDDSPPITSDAPEPAALPAQFRHATGNAAAGQDTFRFETFNNQSFWTTALGLPQGIAAAGITPLQALQVGLSVNVDALNDATRTAVANALAQVATGANPSTTVLGDPAVTLSLINQNAVIGVVAFAPDGTRKPLGNSGTLNIAGGDKVGLTCAACHAITDNSVLAPNAALGTTGSIGRQVDGPTPHGLDVGRIIALGQNSLAYFPMLQLQFKALGNATIGRGNFPGLATTASSVPTEAQADQYLTGTDSVTGERFYPVGQFDAFPDGIGNPVHIAPFFRTALSAPWGIDGGVALLDDFNNTVFTVSLDPTSMLTPGGRAFLNTIAGPVGDEIANDYEQVLRATGVIPAGAQASSVVPFVTAERTDLPPGSPQATTGRRVDNAKLLNLNAYLDSLPAPRAPAGVNQAAAAFGREVFRTPRIVGGGGCTECHQVDPNRFVPPMVVPMATIYPGYMPTVLFNRNPPLSPIQNSGGPSPFFDDRMVVLDASRRGDVRGAALPLLLDLERRTSLLHDDSVRGTSFREAAGSLLNPSRGATAAHPFYINDVANRNDVIEFLRSLETTPP